MHIKQTFFLLWLLIFSACDMMPTIVAEINQIEEKCEVVENQSLFSEHAINPDEEVIVHYRLFLERDKRRYIGACGTHMSPKVGRFLKAQGNDRNSVHRDLYYALDKDKSEIPFYLLCMVGGLASAGRDVGWQRKMVLSRNDGSISCGISVEPNSQPQVLGPRDQDGRLAIEKE